MVELLYVAPSVFISPGLEAVCKVVPLWSRPIIDVTAFSERKYFGSTCSSKMSDNKHSLPVLGDSVIFAVKHLPLAVIPQLIKRGDDGKERVSFVVR